LGVRTPVGGGQWAAPPDLGVTATDIAAAMSQDLHSCFERHFHPEVAVAPSQFEDAFRLRYHVYCLEKGYEDSTQFPDGLERDRYDGHAVQMLVRHRATGLAVGAVRLILPDRSAHSWSFPFEDLCGYTVLGRRLDGVGDPPHDVAEVSRFAVSRNLLASVWEPAMDHWDGAVRAKPDERCSSQLVALGLIALLFGVSAEYGVHTWYAMMETVLARHLARLGIEFRQIGPPVEHRGRRHPMMARVDDLLASVEDNNPAFHRLIVELRNATLVHPWPDDASRIAPSGKLCRAAAG
jgi:N-acyl amino acid synthase of PEP-CTERM/exosortase system